MFTGPKAGVEIKHIDVLFLEGFEDGVKAARVIGGSHGQHFRDPYAVTVALQHIDSLFRIVGNKSDGTDIRGIGIPGLH